MSATFLHIPTAILEKSDKITEIGIPPFYVCCRSCGRKTNGNFIPGIEIPGIVRYEGRDV
jgi:hypothetical protein